MNRMINLSDEELVKVCTQTPSLREVCMDDDFWRLRYRKMFPEYVALYDGKTTWAKFYTDTKEIVESGPHETISKKHLGRPALMEIYGSVNMYPSRYIGYGQKTSLNYVPKVGETSTNHVLNSTPTNHVLNSTPTNHVGNNTPMTIPKDVMDAMVAKTLGKSDGGKMCTPQKMTDGGKMCTSCVSGKKEIYSDSGHGPGGMLLAGGVGLLGGIAIGSAMTNSANNRRDGGYGHCPATYGDSTHVCSN